MSEYAALTANLKTATGPDAALDVLIAEVLEAPRADYTQSIDDCRRLAATVLPGWHLHLGFDGSGVFPYAALSNDGKHVEANGPTVPLALLRTIVAAHVIDLRADDGKAAG
jgi:hypothetical protein